MADEAIPEGGTPPSDDARKVVPLRAQLRPVAIVFAAVWALLAASAIGVTLFGSAMDGVPVALVPLVFSAAPPSEPDRPPQAKSFLSPRVLSGHVVSDPELIEDTFEGPLPKLAADGREARAVYARPFDKNDKRPKIAVLVTGLGVGATVTELAIRSLPPAITLGYAPFGRNPQVEADRARESGHEILLEVPMEPFDFPNSDPGPHALLVGAPAGENIKRLHWAMSRFTGYAGFTHLLGGRFLSEASSIEPVLAEGAMRGLYFFDTGVSARSLTGVAARHANAAIATGTLMLDEVLSAPAIDAQLVKLEKDSRANGYAIGVASPTPVSIVRIADWAAAANERGYHIVPVSALAEKQASTASR